MRSAVSKPQIDENSRDLIRESFLQAQLEAGTKLAESSDVVELLPIPDQDPPERYVLRLHCRGLVRGRDGRVRPAEHFEVGIWFHEGYQRYVEPLKVLTMLYPVTVWHPNIKFPAICAGHITCATTITDLVYQAWEILTFRNWAAHDGLNEAACQWARQNQTSFPTDPRPLVQRSRRGSFEVSLINEPEKQR